MSDNDFLAEYEDTPAVAALPSKEEFVGKPVDVEEPQEIVLEQEPIDDIQTEEDSVDPVDEAARSQGWVPKEEWDGDPSQWRDSQVFLERGDYFKTMSTQRKQIDKLNATVDKMADIQAKTREDERQKVLKELSQEKLEAMEDGNYSQVIDIDAEMDKVKAESAVEAATPKIEVNTNPEADVYSDYIEKNKWYNTNADMRQFADSMAIGYRNANPSATAQDVLEHTDSEVQLRYPQEFGNGAPSASPVAAGVRTTKPQSTKSGANKKTLNDLPPGQREMYAQIGQSFVDSGAVDSIDDYIAELVKIGEL